MSRLVILVSEIFKKVLATPHDIRICAVKVAAVPRVCDASAVGEGQKQPQLVFLIRAENSLRVPEIHLVHAEEIIVARVVAFFELNCALVAAEYAVGSKLALRGRIDRIADVTPDFLCACG